MKSYLKYLALYIFLILLALAGFGYVFNPVNYGLKSLYALDKESVKPDLFKQSPQTLLAGSSRVKWGFDVTDPQLEAVAGSTYNLGVVGARLGEMTKNINYAIAKGSFKTIVIGLDLCEFVTVGSKKIDDNSIVKSPNDKNFLAKIDIITLSESILALARKISATLYDSNLAEDNFFTIKHRLQKLGHRVLTQNAESLVHKQLLSNDWTQMPAQMKMFDSFLAQTCKNNVEIKLFFSPIHARQIALFQTTEKFDFFLKWKNDLTHIVDFHLKSGCKISLTDFSQISEITSEEFPKKNDRQKRMNYYWESSHYSPELGLLVIKKLWNDPSAAKNFGKNLTVQNIDFETSKDRINLQKYIQLNPHISEEFFIKK